jgi:hypothetical protein
MKFKIILIVAIAFANRSVQAQEMNGFRTDNYNGVNGAFFNPANLGNSPFKVDVGIVGMNFYAGNKNQNFSFGTLSDLTADTNVLNSFIGNGTSNSILVNATLHLPSVSFSINEKTTIAFISRARVLFDIHDFDGTLINSITSGANNPSLPYNLTGSTNMRLSANAFSEYGLSGGHVLYNEGNHFIKVGASLKFLSGVGNTYLQLNNIKATLDTVGNTAIATNASGTIAVGVAGIDVNNSDQGFKLGGNASGFGADLGAVYEYRPDDLQEETIPYLFKASIALLDIGGIKYNVIPNQTAGYTINIPAGASFDLSKFDGETKDTLDKYTQYFTKIAPVGSYRVALPRTLQIGGDYRAVNHFYIAANMQLAMTNNKSKAYNPRAVNALTITPRFESKLFAAYLPLNFSNLSKTSIGLGLRAGPLYIGSASLISSIMSKSKQMDFYFGFRVGFKSKKERDDNNS